MPIPGIHDAQDFPPSDAPGPRLRRMKLSHILMGMAARIAPRTTPPVPTEEKPFLDVVYPSFFRRAWSSPPRVPRELAAADADVPAEIAVRGPFASYLRRVTAADIQAGLAASTDQFLLDLSWMLGYDVAPGLVVPGGTAVLEVRAGRLHTACIHRPEARDVRPGAAGYARARAALLAGINEDLTTFRHNIS